MSTSSLIALFVATTSTNQYTPSFPGGLVAWWICNGRKRQQIGGWLLFYYWQLYSGTVMTIIFLAMGIQSYVPESFDDPTKYHLFLLSTVPNLLVLFLEVAVATILVSVRTWDILRLLRSLMMVSLITAAVGTTIDIKYFPNNLGFDALIITPACLWLAYFFASKRAKHVFMTHDWDVVVDRIYPLEPTKAVI
jgi:hypothetical protein